jgi:3-oxoacyl-[acyl-carrier-protein] synthase III
MLTRPGPAGSRITGLGHYSPERVVTNDDLAKTLDTNDEWIRSRVGIETRHLADDESVADMALAAARHALQDAGVEASAVDMVVVATLSSLDRSPNVAGRVAQALGANSPVILDVNVACSGFVHALAVADQAVRTGAATTAIVIGSEKLSDFADWTDRSTAVLLGDGAGAVVLQAADEVGVGPVAWGSESELTSAIRVEAPNLKFTQDGRGIMRWALTRAAGHVREAVDAAGLSLDDIQVFVPHQANLRIIEPLTKALDIEDRVIVTDLVDSGNTSAASIPLGLSRWWHAGKIPADAPALLFGFGGGFAYAGMVVLTPKRR